MNLRLSILTFLVLATALGCTRIVDSVESDESGWVSQESEHYRFHVRPGSQAESELPQIIQEQEWAYEQLQDQLGYRADQRLQVYLYESRHDMQSTGFTGKAYPEIATIEAIYSADIKAIGRRGVSLHELTHIAAYYAWCPPQTSFFSEGLAVRMDDYWSSGEFGSNQLYQIAKIRLRRDELPSIADLIKNWDDFPTAVSYPTAGAFVKYLIQQQGTSHFRQLYCRARTDNFSNVYFDIYEQRIDRFANEFRQFLQDY